MCNTWEQQKRTLDIRQGPPCRPGTHPVIEGNQQRAWPCLMGASMCRCILGSWWGSVPVTPGLLHRVLLLLLQRAEVD